MTIPEAVLLRSKEHDIVRSYHNDICCVLSRSEETLMQFAGMLYGKKIIDVHTKNTVIRKKGYEGADVLMDRVEMKVQQTPTQLRRVLRAMKKLEDLEVISRRIGTKIARWRRRSAPISESDRSPGREGSIEPPSSVESSFSMVIRTAETLKKSFENLLVSVLSVIANVDILVLKLKLNWYISSELQNTPEVKKHLDELESVGTSSAVLNFLVNRHFIGYLNYELLEVIKDTVSNDDLSSKIHKYKANHDKFLQSTEFRTLVKVFQKKPEPRPASAIGLPKFTLHLESPWEGRDAYSWKDLLDKQFNWPPHVHVTSITRNCIIIEYSVLPFFASAVRDLTDPLVLAVLKRQGVTIKLSLELIKMGREELNHRLRSAVTWGTVNEVEELIKGGADVHEKDKDVYTPLHLAAESGKTGTVEALIKHGADVHDETIEHYTPLHLAAKSGKTDTVEALIKHGADVHNNSSHYTPLHLAAKYGKTDTVEALIKHGADVHKETSLHGYTPLHLAAESGKTDTVKALIKHGADVQKETSSHGYTPLYLAAKSSKTDTVEALIKHGADVHSSPLHLTAKSGKTDTVEALIKADVHV